MPQPIAMPRLRSSGAKATDAAPKCAAIGWLAVGRKEVWHSAPSRWRGIFFMRPSLLCLQCGRQELGRAMMKRIALALVVIAIGCTTFGADLFAQSNQTAPPVPLTAPTINTTTLQCQISCDTQAMNCLNSCVVPVLNPTVPAGATSPCNLSCTSSQLTCKQRC